MKYLLLMRHAKSSWKDAALPDRERPLKKRGKQDAPRMGQHILGQGLLVDTVLCSTAVRARATAEGFLEAYTFERDVHYLDELYHADPGTIIALLKQLPEDIETALVIGHNPEFDGFLEHICEERVHMPTASVAYIRFALARWTDLNEATSGELLHLWMPREI